MTFQSLFVTGTDTGVGKTTVACGIAAALRQSGCTVGVFKPSETGCRPGSDGQLQPNDALRLRFFAGSDLDLRTICPYPLREPLAPLLAAQRDGVRIDVDEICRIYGSIAAAHDLTLIEGAGGLLVPLAPGVTFADVAARLDAPLLVVVGSRLGAINHALLSVRYAQSMGLRVLGYVVNFLKPNPDLAERTNVKVLSDWLGPPLGVIDYLADLSMTAASRQRLAEHFTAHLRLDSLRLPPLRAPRHDGNSHQPY